MEEAEVWAVLIALAVAAVALFLCIVMAFFCVAIIYCDLHFLCEVVFDTDAANVASRLNTLSINPDKRRLLGLRSSLPSGAPAN